MARVARSNVVVLDAYASKVAEAWGYHPRKLSSPWKRYPWAIRQVIFNEENPQCRGLAREFARKIRDASGVTLS